MSLMVFADSRPKAGEASLPQPGWLSRLVLSATAWIRCHAERRRAIAQLTAMTDCQLHDIGLTRADIHDAVAGRRAPRR